MVRASTVISAASNNRRHSTSSRDFSSRLASVASAHSVFTRLSASSCSHSGVVLVRQSLGLFAFVDQHLAQGFEFRAESLRPTISLHQFIGLVAIQIEQRIALGLCFSQPRLGADKLLFQKLDVLFALAQQIGSFGNVDEGLWIRKARRTSPIRKLASAAVPPPPSIRTPAAEKVRGG